ncbi:hypothetical protein AB0M39_39600 [Streptomyces sp. NPDC051907]|uniref:hypothetical protein n=1 Tax=Streptomyces sp. NPDC051907 TaxID=3155284 RepID=UPI00343C33E1
MELASVGAATAGVRAVGSVTTALIGRYRPVGVVRVGSPEDRSQTYRRFIEAAARFGLNAAWAASAREQPKSEEPFFKVVLPALRASGNELVCALFELRLCAPVYVIGAAEKLAAAASALGGTGEEFKQANAAYGQAENAFLEVARHDLNYHPKWWQPWRRQKEKTFRRKQEKAISAQGSTA